MVWYWNVLIGVGAFNLAFVLLAWLIAVIRERTGSDIEIAGVTFRIFEKMSNRGS